MFSHRSNTCRRWDGQWNWGSCHPFACFCCYQISDCCLSCGHLCCLSCVNSLEDAGSVMCSVCRTKTFKWFDIKGSQELNPECQACGKVKIWLIKCGHVTCTCNSSRCVVCDSLSQNFESCFHQHQHEKSEVKSLRLWKRFIVFLCTFCENSTFIVHNTMV